MTTYIETPNTHCHVAGAFVPVSSIANPSRLLAEGGHQPHSHAHAPDPLSLRGAAPEVFACGVERELAGSRYMDMDMDMDMDMEALKRRPLSMGEARAAHSTILGLICCMVFLAAFYCWGAAVDAKGDSRTTSSALGMFLVPLIVLTILFIARLTLSDDALCNVWAMGVLGMPLPRVAFAMLLPRETLAATLRAAQIPSVNVMITLALVLGGALHVVVPYHRSRRWKLQLIAINYSWEFLICALAFGRLSRDGAHLRECMALAAFGKLAPFFLGYVAVEFCLHLFRQHAATCQQQLDAAKALLTEREEAVRRLSRENRKLEESGRDMHLRNMRKQQQAKMERQQLLSCMLSFRATPGGAPGPQQLAPIREGQGPWQANGNLETKVDQHAAPSAAGGGGANRPFQLWRVLLSAQRIGRGRSRDDSAAAGLAHEVDSRGAVFSMPLRRARSHRSSQRTIV